MESKKRKITISDHARIRYLQRVKGLDLKRLDEEILPKKIIYSMDSLRVDSIKYSIQNHCVLIVNNIVKSVLPKKPKARRRSIREKKDYKHKKKMLDIV